MHHSIYYQFTGCWLFFLSVFLFCVIFYSLLYRSIAFTVSSVLPFGFSPSCPSPLHSPVFRHFPVLWLRSIHDPISHLPPRLYPGVWPLSSDLWSDPCWVADASLTHLPLLGVCNDHGKTYALYTLTVFRKNSDGSEDTWKTYRRYSDFHDFHMRITEQVKLLRGSVSIWPLLSLMVHHTVIIIQYFMILIVTSSKASFKVLDLLV